MTDERRDILALCERIYRFHPNEDTMAEWIAAALATARQAVWEEVTTRLLVRLNRVVEDGELPVIEHELEAWIRWCRKQAQKEAP